MPDEGEDAKKSRPVLDAIHERATGKLRVRVNDGRDMNTTESAAVDIAITNVGVVLFNPRTMVREEKSKKSQPSFFVLFATSSRFPCVSLRP